MVVVVLVLVVVVVVAATAVGDAAVGDNDAAAAAAVGRTASGIVPAPELPMLLSVVAGVDRFDGDAVAVVVAVVAVVVVLWSLPAAIELLLLALPLTIPIPLLLLPLLLLLLLLVPLTPALLLPLLLLLLLLLLLPLLLPLLATSVVRTSDCSAGVAIFKSFSMDASLAAALDPSIRKGFSAAVASLLRVATTNNSTSSIGGMVREGSCESGLGGGGSPSFSAASR